MDKVEITEIVHQASLDIKTLFSVWYENRDVDESIITSKIDEWESLIEKWKNELRIGIITNVRLTEELTKNIEKAFKLFHEILKEGESNTHIISDMPHNFMEFILLCDIKLYQCFLDFLNNTHSKPKPARQEATTKIWALYYWYIREIGELPEIDSGIKKGLYALAGKKNVSGQKMYKIFNTIGNPKYKNSDLNPMKANILEQVIPLLIDYPKAQSRAESDYQSIMNRGE